MRQMQSRLAVQSRSFVSSVCISLLVFRSAHGFAVPLLSRRSAPPPRFDVFLEKIGGMWHEPERKCEVEEVMRSCGGAVQGVNDLGVYLNRADDGFLYFDCGSYCGGPLQTQDDGKQMLTSLTFSSNRRNVLRIDSPFSVPASGDELVISRMQRQGPPSSDSTEKALFLELRRELSCSMPSEGQPWNLQRAKWEQQTPEEDSDVAKWDPSASAEVVVAAGAGFQNWMAAGECWTAWDEVSALAAGGGHAVQMGGVCLETGEAKAVMRCYDAEGKLARVILQEGIRVESAM